MTRTVRVFAPVFGGLSRDRAFVLALRRLMQSGELPTWPLYSLDKPDTDLSVSSYARRAHLRGVFTRKDR